MLIRQLSQVKEEKKNVVEREKELDEMENIIKSALEDQPRIKDKPPTRVDYLPEDFRTPNTIIRQPPREGKRAPLTCEYLFTFDSPFPSLRPKHPNRDDESQLRRLAKRFIIL